MEEVRVRTDAAIRYGIILKDEREAAIASFAGQNLPEKAPKPLNLAAIERRFQKKAKEQGSFASYRIMYNSGQIGMDTLNNYFAQENAAQLAAAQMKQQRAQQALAILAVNNQMMAANNQMMANAYSPPPSVPQFQNVFGNQYSPNSLSNPYGAGSPYKANGLMNPYSQYGSPYSNKSWTNPYATNAPKIFSPQGKYHGRLSTNPYAPDSTSNPYGRYGSKYSPDSLNNPYGAGNPYSGTQYLVVPQ